MPRQTVPASDVKALEKRATKARISIGEAHEALGISRVTWWRWTKNGAPMERFTLLENEIARREAEAAA